MPALDDARQLLVELRALAPDDDADAVEELVRRLDTQALRVLVVGEAKRGKSTLVNALLDRDLLPTGVLPLTAVATTVRYGHDEQVAARFSDGTSRRLPVDCLGELVTEQGNPRNVRGVAEVTVSAPVPLLAGGLELVDSPGVGSVHAHNTTQAMAALERMDAAIFVLTADPPISASEQAFLRQVRGGAVTVFCVLNKADRLDSGEREQAVRFTQQVVRAELGEDVPVFPLSARAALEPAGFDAGFAQFRDAFSRYLVTAGSHDLTRSVAVHAGRLARSVAETQQATLAALTMSARDLTARVRTFEAALDAVGEERLETAALAAGGFHRLQADTDAQAVDLMNRTRPAFLREVADRLQAATGSPGAIEAETLAYTAESIRRVVDDWRASRAAELNAAVISLGAKLTGRLAGHINTVRDAAAQLFSIALPALPAAEGLTPATGFSYAFAPDPGQVDALAATLRRRLPSRLARRQVTRYVTERAALLLDKHVGRARAAFQAQLAETRRRFDRELERRFAEGAGRIADAVSAAAELQTTQQPRAAAVRRQAQSILDQARLLADRCDTLAEDRRADRGAAVT